MDEHAGSCDLAGRPAGSAVRAQAEIARSAAPIRSVLARLMGVHSHERAWRLGAEGEEAVGKQLDRLIKREPGWHVLHSIPVGERGADIDHLVIGRGGVFAINTKHHPGGRVWISGDAVRVGGARHPYVRNSRHEASRAARLLSGACGFSVDVVGVLVFVNAGELVVKHKPNTVAVLARRQLVRWMRAQPDCLDVADVEAIHASARRSDTWSRVS